LSIRESKDEGRRKDGEGTKSYGGNIMKDNTNLSTGVDTFSNGMRLDKLRIASEVGKGNQFS